MSAEFSELFASLYEGEAKNSATRLLQLMFKVSLLKHEGVHVKCAIAWCDSEPDLKFESPIPLTLPNLRDVAAAAPGMWQAIALNGDKECTGLLDLRRPWTVVTQPHGFIEHDRFAHTQRPLVRPDVTLLIKITNPGVIEVAVGRADQIDQLRFLWLGGDLLKQRDIINVHDFALAFGFHESQQPTSESLFNGDGYRKHRAAYGRGKTVRAIVKCMIEAGHGGSLVVINGPECPAEITIGVRTSGSKLGEASANRSLHVPGPSEPEPECPDDLVTAELAWVRAIDIVSGLTQHDGAVVLNSNLQLFGYGARLPVHIDEGAEILTIDWHNFDSSSTSSNGIRRTASERRTAVRRLDAREFLRDKGLRHTSGIATCLSLRKVMVIVVSQDGAVTVISSLRSNLVRVYYSCGLANLTDNRRSELINPGR